MFTTSGTCGLRYCAYSKAYPLVHHKPLLTSKTLSPALQRSVHGRPLKLTQSVSAAGSWATPEEEWAYGSGGGFLPGRPGPKAATQADGPAWRLLNTAVEFIHWADVGTILYFFLTLLRQATPMATAQAFLPLMLPIFLIMAVGVGLVWEEYEGWQGAPARAPSTALTSGGSSTKPFVAGANNLWLRQVGSRHLFIYFAAGFICFNAGVLGWHTPVTAALLAVQVALFVVGAWVRPCILLPVSPLFPAGKWKGIEPAVLPLPRLLLPAVSASLTVFSYTLAIKTGVVPAVFSWANFAAAAGMYSALTAAVMAAWFLLLRSGPSQYWLFQAFMTALPIGVIWAVNTFWTAQPLLILAAPLVLMSLTGVVDLLLADTTQDEYLHFISQVWFNVGLGCICWMLRTAAGM